MQIDPADDEPGAADRRDPQAGAEGRRRRGRRRRAAPRRGRRRPRPRPPRRRSARRTAWRCGTSSRAGTDWLRALPIGNGRLGAMVFGNVDVERLQLNEDTIWAGGPYDQSNTAGRRGAGADPAGVFANQWGQAQTLIDQNMLGIPVGAAGVPDHGQPAADVRRRELRGVGVHAVPGPEHGRGRRQLPAERCAVPARDARQRTGPGDRGAADRGPGRLDHVLRDVRQPAAHHGVQPGRRDRRDRRGLRRPARAVRQGQVLRPGAGGRRRRHRQQLRRHAAGPVGQQRDAARVDRHQLRQLPRRQRRLPGQGPRVPHRGGRPDLGRPARPARRGLPAAVRAHDAGPRPHGRGRPAHRRADLPARERQRPAVLGAAVPVRPVPADLLLPARHPTGEPAGHLERLAEPRRGTRSTRSTRTCR